MHDRFQISLMEKLQAAREDLVTLLSKYTELHPAVREQRARIEELQRQLNGMAAETPTEAGRPVEQIAPGALAGSSTNSSAATRKESDFEILRTQLQALETARTQLAGRQREAQLFEKDAPGYAQLLAPATLKSVTAKDRLPKIILLTVFGGMMGVAGCVMLLLGAEFMDERLKTAADVKRVTRLPLLSSVGNLHRLDPTSQDRWAFRTWTALQNRLSCSPHHGFVCGITSARAGEGRSTWLRLLAQAASQCGFRVLTIGTAPNPDPDEDGAYAGSNGESNGDPDYNPNGTALTTHVLSSPALVTEKLVGNDPQPYVHIPLPGWVWNLERRREWQSALNQWSKIQNIVILVELPPASVPEAILLAENLPNLVWLTRSGTVTATETRLHLETLRLARSQVVGAVLNREPSPPLQHRFQRWFGCGAVLLALSCGSLRAADLPANSANPIAPPPPGVTAPAAVAPPADTAPAPEAAQAPTALPATNSSFSVSSPKRAPWQEHFTLGPGDVLNFSLYGQPELSRAEVFVGPDGRVSFLQAQDIVAAGLTVDELRARFDDELGKFYRTPRTIISPVAFHSKKYYVLGKVMNRGVFPLDRPLTIVEALARAKGLETGLLPDNRNMVDLADLQRSFVMRRGKRLPVNLEKLFQEGDLSQNVALEPEDYLYFAAANLRQVYVLGEVNLPGPLAYTGNMTAVGAISARGGFTQRAYKGKVLVIRGSLNRPQTFVVDVWEATEGRTRDMKLEPKDIVYVNYRPFIKAEDLLDLGITAFLQSVTVEWTGLHIDPRTQ
jgi:protein involved in polysaccharide export with SLBB domain/Mrp family chromosome partitioning ATPase